VEKVEKEEKEEKEVKPLDPREPPNLVPVVLVFNSLSVVFTVS
jgi:hypothetical protein